jgi:hypothetical protein
MGRGFGGAFSLSPAYFLVEGQISHHGDLLQIGASTSFAYLQQIQQTEVLQL